MKKLFKMFATILAVSVLTIGFASCANDSSDSSSSSSSAASSSASSGSSSSTSVTIAATYKGDSSDGQNFLFYSNGEFKIYNKAAETAGVTNGITRKGTFAKTGDTYSDCTLTISWTQKMNGINIWVDKPGTKSYTVSGGKFTEEEDGKTVTYTLEK